MSWIAVGTAVVGGALQAKSAKDTAKAGSEGQENAAAIIRESADEAKKVVFEMSDIAQQNYQAGTQAGLNVLGQSIAPQSQLARGGNVAAQEQLIAGLGQQQNALLGRPVDMTQLQAYEGGAIPEINYQIPEFQSVIPESEMVNRQIAGDNEQQVADAYQQILGRAPDAGGLKHYSQYIQGSAGEGANPKRIKELRKEMSKSAEGKRYAGGM